jgi:hypothetical protein
MWQFWDLIIEPVLSAAEAKTVVEIGAEKGLNTSRLGEWAAKHGASIHVIDPNPEFDFGAAGHLVNHNARSLEALPLIERPDAVLIDGDHNWYTVTEELRLLERMSTLWPVTFVHDIGWPYGRRDMYYEPESIPAEYRQPYARSGMVPGRSPLSPDGRNAVLANATHEGGPRNGVLTAVEDFMDESVLELELFAVQAQGVAELGLLLDRSRLGTDVGPVVARIHDQPLAVGLSPRYASRYFDSAPLREGSVTTPAR